MEINEPERGIFKGIGRLETHDMVNKKFFPNLRNKHQFEYTHQHSDSYKTSCGVFKKFDKKEYHYTRSKGNQNKSNFQIGVDSNRVLNSQNRRCFRKYESSLPPKPYRQKEQGIGIDQYEKRTGENLGKFPKTTNEAFNELTKRRQSDSIIYKYTRSERFNPITGEFKGNKTNFGYQDYAPNKKKNYCANNFTVIPVHGEKIDIISGRKLTYG